MTDTALVISDLPAAGTLTGAELVELQVGTGAGSSKKVTVADLRGNAGSTPWAIVGVATTMVSGQPYIVTAAVDMAIPTSVAAGTTFIVHAKVAGVRIVSNGNLITGVGSGNDLTLAAAETASLVASAASTLEVL